MKSLINFHRYIRKMILGGMDFLFQPFEKLLNLQTFRYILCGGGITVLDIMLFWVFYNFLFKGNNLDLGLLSLSPHVASLFLSYSITLPTGFYLNRFVVFPDSGLGGQSQLLRFVGITLLSVLLNYLFLRMFVELAGVYPSLAKVITTVIVVVFSYVMQTYVLFRARSPN